MEVQIEEGGVYLTWEGDELGPEKVLLARDPRVGLEAIVVVDNTAAGPAIGGVRLAPDIEVEEVARLARAMTYKNAAACLPFGGGKAGIVADPMMADKEPLVRAFGRAIRHVIDYIPGPDMGLDEPCMGHLYDEIGRAVGLPRVLGGIPLDEIGATALGLAVAAEVAEDLLRLPVAGARVVVQGFGAVGLNAARFLHERGAVLVGACDIRGAVINPNGLDVEKLVLFKDEGRPVVEFPGGEPVANHVLVGLDCDIWVPAARPDVFTEANAGDVKAKLILPGANLPATPEAEQIFHERGIVMIPDFIANAGGVICASVEYAGGTEAQARAAIEDKIRANVAEVLNRSRRDGAPPRRAAMALARARIEEAMRYRRAR